MKPFPNLPLSDLNLIIENLDDDLEVIFENTYQISIRPKTEKC